MKKIVEIGRKIVKHGYFKIEPAPFGLKIKFFDDELIFNLPKPCPERRRKFIALFYDELDGAYRVRLQIGTYSPHFSFISQAYVHKDTGYQIDLRIPTDIQFGDPVSPNPVLIKKAK